MKNTIFQFLSVNSSFLIGFALSTVAAFLLVSHFQHTILQAWFGVEGITSSQENNVEGADAAYIAQLDSSEDMGCGCALCCSIPGL